MIGRLTLWPAFGKRFDTKKDVVAAFEGGHDFLIVTPGRLQGRYVSKKELKSHGDKEVLVRWSKKEPPLVLNIT